MLIGDKSDKCIALAAFFSTVATSMLSNSTVASLAVGGATTFGLYAVRYALRGPRPS